MFKQGSESEASTALPSLATRQPTSQSSRARSYSRPPPITVDSCSSPRDLRPTMSSRSPSHRAPSNSRPTQILIEPLDSPAFLKGDLNFATYRERAALAIAEWGPSPTSSQFPMAAGDLRTPRRTQFKHSVTSVAAAQQGLKVPSSAHPPAGTAHLPSPPPTPLTPGPHSRPQHREQNPITRRSSLKLKRPRPSPLQLKQPKLSGKSEHMCHDEMKNFRNVRFADGSPLRGSTWHITQYPARLASPPISAANLSLADLVELESIKQSLGTWCGEMMGSPMRCSFSQSSACSLSESDGNKSWAPPRTPIPNSDSYYSSPVSLSEDYKDIWGEVKWPDSPGDDSDCDSEIFEGMH